MSVYKFLTATVIMMAIALAYVGQQTALFRLSYDIKDKERLYSELLDRGKILLYNIKQLESPARLEKALLSKNKKLEVPSRERVILVAASPKDASALGRENDNSRNTGALRALRKIGQSFAGIFTFGPEAQAGTVEKKHFGR
ncbi:MAG: hypothetical protein V1933_04335 [Candidatus Omnitrophota bacterium]